ASSIIPSPQIPLALHETKNLPCLSSRPLEHSLETKATVAPGSSGWKLLNNNHKINPIVSRETKNTVHGVLWWTWRESNSLPPQCECGALPDELQAPMQAILRHKHELAKRSSVDVSRETWCPREES